MKTGNGLEVVVGVCLLFWLANSTFSQKHASIIFENNSSVCKKTENYTIFLYKAMSYFLFYADCWLFQLLTQLHYSVVCIVYW